MQRDKAKPAGKARDRKPQREEFDLACSTREPGRHLQRKPLQQQQMEPSGSASTAAHGEDSSFDSPSSPPRHDRAG